MFTGIVQGKGRVAAIERNAFGLRLTLDTADWPRGAYEPKHGDSICVSGTCLTVADADAAVLSFDVIRETLDMTTLGRLKIGDEVNLEPSVTPNQPLGGHFMQGHVDGVGTVANVTSTDSEWRLTIRPPEGLMDYIVPKGSIAIDGVSLTVAAVGEDTFDVALIPTTLDLTTLRERKAGDAVNLEADILSKTVVNYLRRVRRGAGSESLSMATLVAAGFADAIKGE